MKRIASLLSVLFLWVASAAAAEPPLCKGTDLLAKLAADDPAAYAEVMAEAKKTPNGEAMLWKIERQGVAASWLFGTAHVTDPRVTTLPPQAAEALAGAQTVALELKEIRDPQEMALASMKLARLMVLPPDKSLWDLIPDDREATIRDNINMPPGGGQTVFGYQPWVVAAMLSIPLCEYRRNQAGVASLDESIARQAEAQGAELVGLETVEEQLSVFAAMPLDLQAKYLMAVAKFGDRAVDYFETLISLYSQRLVTAYIPLSVRIEPPDDDTAAIMVFMEKELTTRRNHVMERRAKDLLAQGNAFIAVGAMHLPGDEGLVALIRQAGYKVTPVN